MAVSDRLLRGCCIGLIALGAAACPDPAARRDRAQRQLSDEGARTRSPALRTADERPKPWVEEKRPLDADRMDLEPYRAERHARRGEPGQLSGAECLRLQESYPCPLLAHRWSARDVPDGILLTATATQAQADRLRDFVRCHQAARPNEAQATCIGQLGRVRLSGAHRAGQITITLSAESPDAASALRARVRELIREAR